MTSKIKVDNINKVSDDTNIINKCGTSITVGTGSDTTTVPGAAVVTGNVTGLNVIASGNVVKSNAYQASDAGNIINQSGTAITIGASGDTVSLASGASQSGFGRSGSVNWQTGSIKTTTFTAANGEGYFVNTSGGAVTCNLPAGTAGHIVAVNDYANNAATHNITIASDGSEKIQGQTTNHLISTNGVTVTLVYVDGTQGWKLVDTGEATSLPQVALFTAATGGNDITTCGDYKIHTFTAPGTFTVSQVGNSPTNPSGGPSEVEYLVAAGGGSGGGDRGGGGGGGGVITNFPTPAGSIITLTATGIPVTVGGGGSGVGDNSTGTQGSSSVFSTITAAGGGKGGSAPSAGSPGGAGGSGGGGAGPSASAGPGNNPSIPSPNGGPQGNNGGTNPGPLPGLEMGGGGGGGKGGTGGNGGPSSGGNGGSGSQYPTGILVPAVTFGPPARYLGAGGGGGRDGRSGGSGGSGGTGGGSAGQSAANPTSSTSNGPANSGAGTGGRGVDPPSGTSGNGGSGVVVIRYKFQ